MSGEQQATSAIPSAAPEHGASPAGAPQTGSSSETSEPGAKAAGGADGLTAAAKDPLGEQGAAANEAYQRGRKSFQDGGNHASFHGNKIKNVYLGDNRAPLFANSGSSKTSALVREKVLERIRGTYTLVARYERMLGAVREHRLVLLRGMPNTGMSTTAVRLLDEVTDGRVARLDLAGGVESIREKDLTKKRGYVIAVPTSDLASVPTETQLDALGEMLAKRRCHCVLLDTSGVDTGDELDGYVFDYTPPDRHDLLRRHVGWRLRPDDPPGTEKRLLDLAKSAHLRDALGSHPRPGDVVRMAGLLVRHARDQLDIADVVAGCDQYVQDQVGEWLAVFRSPKSPGKNKTSEALGLVAFRIALAVLNISPYDVVAKAGEKLDQLIMADVDPTTKTRRRSSISLDQHGVLTATRAHAVPSTVTFGADIPVTCYLVEYEDDRFPVAVLRHVWQQHQWMRQVLVKWLTELGTDPNPMVWVRAAQAAGLLSALDFPYGYANLIAPGAFEEDVNLRDFAAVALDQASQDADTRDAVHAFLVRWRRWGDQPERATAAAALGYGLGLEDIDLTLDSLRILGTPGENLEALEETAHLDSMVLVVSRSLSRLLAFGAVTPVLTALTGWLGHRRTSMRMLARWAVVRLIMLRGFHLAYLDVSGGRDYRTVAPAHLRWPLLLALQDADHSLTEPVAELLRLALRTRHSDEVAECLRTWIKIGQEDLACLLALARFLPRLVKDSHDAARLIHIMVALRRDWAEPIRPEVATELEDAIRSAIPRETQLWTTPTAL